MENKDISSTEYVIEYKDEYFEDIEKHSKSGQKKLIEKIITLLDEIKYAPKVGIGHPEALRYECMVTKNRRKTSIDL